MFETLNYLEDNKKIKEIYIKTWKRDEINAFNYAIEEMVELIKAICKFKEGRGSLDDIAREVADVQVTVNVLECILPKITKKEKILKLIKLDSID